MVKKHHNRASQAAAGEWRRMKTAFGIPSVVLVLGVLFGQSLISAITSHLSLEGDLVWLATVACGALYVFLRYRYTYMRSAAQMRTRILDGTNERLDDKRALICLLGLESGRATSPLALLLSQMTQLDYLVLLGTPETKALGISSQITHELLGAAGFTLASDHVMVYEQGDSYSMEDFELACRQGVRWLTSNGVATTEIVCDVTAGKRAMGFGVLLAADRTGVEVQYRDSNWDRQAKNHVPGRLVWRAIHEKDHHHVEM